MAYMLFFNGLRINGQQKSRKVKTSEFEYLELAVPKKAPTGYVSVKTYEWNRKLEPGTTYEASFWIIGKQVPTRFYSFPITLFLAKPADHTLISNSEEIEPVHPSPQLEVRPPPSFTARGHFTFLIKPRYAYQNLTIALQKVNNQNIPTDFIKSIKIIGFHLQPSSLKGKMENIKTPPEKTTLSSDTPLAERKLMDSGQTYSIPQRNVQIGLYDHRNIDHDRVTIYLNDKIIVERLPLAREKKYYDIELQPGPNTITLYAENLGEVGPNTAAIIIKGTSIEFMAVLESDLGQSQFFTLINTER